MQHTIRWTITAFALVGFLIRTTPTGAFATQSKVERCTIGSHLVISQTGRGGAGGQFLFGVAITNRGTADCSIVMPLGQPVNGPRHVPVSRPSRRDIGTGYGNRWPLVLKPGNPAKFWYAVNFYQLYTRAQCHPVKASGAIVRLKGIQSIYLRITGRYADEVCEKRTSTSIIFLGMMS